MKEIINQILDRFLASNKTMPNNRDLQGYVAVVTGAGKGIGKAIAERLIAEGASVVVLSRNISELKKSYASYSDGQVVIFDGDVTSEKDMDNVVKTTLKKFGRVDLLVNNAGINFHKGLDDTEVEEFESIVNTNIKGVFLAARAVIPVMKKQKAGLIINIGSKISHNTNVGPGKVLYATTKYAVEGFSYALNKELKEFGVRVVCLMPGTVRTFFSRKANDYLNTSEIADLVIAIIRMKGIDFEGIVFKSVRQNI